MDSKLNRLAALVKANPEDAGLVAEYVQAMLRAGLKVQVRERQSFGPCAILGDLLGEKPTHYVYRSVEMVGHGGGVIVPSKTKTAKKNAKARSRGMAKPAPHVLPCLDCLDHPETRRGPGSCIHGRQRGEFCESCMSM